MGKMDEFTPIDYLEMVKAQIPADKSPGKQKTVAWLKDIQKQLDEKLRALEQP